MIQGEEAERTGVHGVPDAQRAAVAGAHNGPDELGMPPRYYLRRDDVRTDLLRPTTFHTSCPFKGEASYWSLELDGEVLDGIAWSYETPIAGAEPIAGLFCFYQERVDMRVGTTEDAPRVPRAGATSPTLPSVGEIVG